MLFRSDDVAIADVAFRAWGEDLAATVVAAAAAMMNVMVGDLASLRPRRTRRIEIGGEPPDMLLFELLQELIYYKDAESLLLTVADIEVTQRDGAYALSARAEGEAIDPQRHRMIVDVKAVTLHRFSVERTDHGWEAFVIVDV